MAHYHGPRETLEALASRLLGSRSSPESCDLLICRTSDEAAGRDFEAAACRSANLRGTPIVWSRIFPATTRPCRAPQLIFVESEFAA